MTYLLIFSRNSIIDYKNSVGLPKFTECLQRHDNTRITGLVVHNAHVLQATFNSYDLKIRGEKKLDKLTLNNFKDLSPL